jgi:enamine deaminase RidA (YjgF/YER057c/UK114 family)
VTPLISSRLAQLGIQFAPPSTAGGSYAPTVVAGDLLYVSGQTSRVRGDPAFIGRLGENVSEEEGVEAARAAAICLISQIGTAVDDRLDQVRRIIRIGVFIASTPEFANHSIVANGASDLLIDVFGAAGHHARTAVGVASLPSGVAVELEAMVLLNARDLST